MTRIFTQQEIKNINRIKAAYLKLKAQRKVEVRRKLEELKHSNNIPA